MGKPGLRGLNFSIGTADAYSCRYSKAEKAYLLPATPDTITNLDTIAGETGIKFTHQLPQGYARRQYAPNSKKIKLGNIVANRQRQIPLQVQTYVNAMMDYLMAKNYSDSTLRTYTEAFLLFCANTSIETRMT